METTTHQSIRSSFVIPVYNKWELTEACLRSLAATLAGASCEIIIIDNASTDATPVCCPALGQELFGSLFRYHRAEQNCNFGPASNLGAKMARSEYVLFLNNDTLALPDCPNWHELLLGDFAGYPDIAATGPLLLHPPHGALGARVQHLGVFITDLRLVGHLYEGIPASSMLAQKRRFFQVITAACMLMPRALFLEHGGFNEGYVNGFEDVDLCARLCAAGYRMTINPASRLYHLVSQTPGRHTHELENSRLLARTGMRLLLPDWRAHLAADGLELHEGEGSQPFPCMPAAQRAKLAPLLKVADAAELRQVLDRFPCWHEGYLRLAALLEAENDLEGVHTVLSTIAFLRPDLIVRV